MVQEEMPLKTNLSSVFDAGVLFDSSHILICNTAYYKIIPISLDTSQIILFIMEYPEYSAWCLFFGVLPVLLLLPTSKEDISYSAPEERKIESVIGNLANDLGINAKTLALCKVHLDVEGDSKCYCDIDINTGDLTVANRIDREQLCGFTTVCRLRYEVILENPF